MSGPTPTPGTPSVARWLAKSALDLLYPERCLECGAFGTLLCPGCEATLEPAVGAARCPNCAARWDAADNCPRCFGWEALDRVHAAYEMDGPARKVVHGLKYRGIRALAGRMAAAVAPIAPAFDVAMPVPLHRSRQRRRGFNQAALLLHELGWPRAEGRLLRTRNTPHQVGLHHGERRSNVAGAFAYRGPSLAGLTVALVDDVVTTAATVNECARVLRDYGARHVVAVAYARASYDSAGTRPIPD